MKLRRLALGMSLLIWAGVMASVIGGMTSVDSVFGIALSSMIAFFGGCLFTSGLSRGF
jgi:hypothetical protein